MAVMVKGKDGSVQSVAAHAESEGKKAFEQLEPEVKELVVKAAKKVQATGKDPKAKLDFILATVRKEANADGIAVKGSEVPDVERIPTGIFEVDSALGGGFPKGRIVIVYGVESSGKTNLVLKAIIFIQLYFPKACNRVAFVNLEGTYDPEWFKKLGGDPSLLDVINPPYGEKAVDIVDAVLRAEDLAMCVVDSIAVMVSSREVEASVEKADVGTSAILVKRMCNKAVIALAEEALKGHYPTLVLVNQRRFKVGVMFGDPETMPGGETMKFLSSLTVRLYGKNVVEKEIHPDLPAWKHTTVIVKKAKVPITAVNFEYKMAMIQAGDVDIGDTDSWAPVSGHLKAAGRLVKMPQGGWVMGTDVRPSLVAFQEEYVCNLAFRVKCQQEVIKMLSGKKFTIAEKEEAPPAPETPKEE